MKYRYLVEVEIEEENEVMALIQLENLSNDMACGDYIKINIENKIKLSSKGEEYK
ncbi:MAG: hypothetical protein AABY22_35745 [Nanoarchaeota archaeon]